MCQHLTWVYYLVSIKEYFLLFLFLAYSLATAGVPLGYEYHWLITPALNPYLNRLLLLYTSISVCILAYLTFGMSIFILDDWTIQLNNMAFRFAFLWLLLNLIFITWFDKTLLWFCSLVKQMIEVKTILVKLCC